MGEEVVRGVVTFTSSLFNGMAEMQGVPVDDDGSEQVEAGDPVLLTLGGAVADLALPNDAQSVLERVMRLALVETDLSTAQERTSAGAFSPGAPLLFKLHNDVEAADEQGTALPDSGAARPHAIHEARDAACENVKRVHPNLDYFIRLLMRMGAAARSGSTKLPLSRWRPRCTEAGKRHRRPRGRCYFQR